MIRGENLRSGYIQDDVGNTFTACLPGTRCRRGEIEDYAAQNRDHHWAAVAECLACSCKSRCEKNFEMGCGDWYSTIGWHARGAEGK